MPVTTSRSQKKRIVAQQSFPKKPAAKPVPTRLDRIAALKIGAFISEPVPEGREPTRARAGVQSSITKAQASRLLPGRGRFDVKLTHAGKRVQVGRIA